MDLATSISSRRKILGISQNDLAEMSGVSIATIKNIERGAGNPSWSTVGKICEVLGLRVSFSIKQTV